MESIPSLQPSKPNLRTTLPHLHSLRLGKFGRHHSASSSLGSSCRTAYGPTTVLRVEIGTTAPPAPYADAPWKLRTTSLRNAATRVEFGLRLRTGWVFQTSYHLLHLPPRYQSNGGTPLVLGRTLHVRLFVRWRCLSCGRFGRKETTVFLIVQSLQYLPL
jgi:hypothetical protein